MSSSSSSSGTSPSDVNQRGPARIHITDGRGKTEPKRYDLYQKVAAKGRTKAATMPPRKPGKQEELQPNVEEEECSLMETSLLRNASMVSDLNLSNAVEIEEFEEVELAKTPLTPLTHLCPHWCRSRGASPPASAVTPGCLGQATTRLAPRLLWCSVPQTRTWPRPSTHSTPRQPTPPSLQRMR